MLSASEYVERFGDNPPDEIWVHGLDLLEHCLRGDTEATFYRNNAPHKEHLLELHEELEKHSTVDEAFKEIRDEGLRKVNKWRPFPNYEGDLDLDRYVEDRECRGPVFTDYRRTVVRKPAMNIVMDAAVPWNDRYKEYMVERHKRVYRTVFQAVSERRPCRVIAAFGVEVPEKKTPTMMFVVIKDFLDPIFPGIWGAYKTCFSTNSFINVIMDYFIGTACMANGTLISWSLRDYFQDDEVVVIGDNKIKT